MLTLKRIILLPIVGVIGIVIGLLFMLLGYDDWSDFKAEFKLLIRYYWNAC